MVISTHMITGALMGQVLGGSTTFAFVGGYFSHFLLDALPHWDYNLSSRGKVNGEHNISFNKDFLKDCLKMGLDFSIGIAVILFIIYNFEVNTLYLLAGALGGIFPDFFQFLFLKIRKEPLIFLNKIHSYFHNNRGLGAYFGIFCQGFVVLSVVITISFLFD